MARKTFILNSVRKYLDGVQKNDKNDFEQLGYMITKLSNKGEAIINGRTYKKLKSKEKLKHPVIQIKIACKQYRIHTALTPNFLYLVHAFDKKTNKTPRKEMSISIKRIKSITEF